MRRPIIGVLGGLGPETTATFYLDIVRAATVTERPPLCIWSIPLSLALEAEFIASGQHRAYLLAQLVDGVLRLERSGATRIVIPCNTVHEFHHELSVRTRVPVANLIELVAGEVRRRGWSEVFLLATSRTIATGLYQQALSSSHIAIRTPCAADQQQLDALIMGILGDRMNREHQRFLRRLIERAGTPNIILGCTDLQLLSPRAEHIIDSTAVLVDHVAEMVRR